MFDKRIMKKGNITDVLETGGIMLTLVITLFLVFTVNSEFGDRIKANNATNITGVTSRMDDFQNKFTRGWDYGFLIIAILFPIFSYIAATKIPIDNKTMIIAFFVLGIIFVLLMTISNIYGKFMDNATFQTFIYNQNIVFIPFLMPKLPYYGIIYLFIVLVGLFTKPET